MPGLSPKAIRQLQYLFKRVQQLETQLKNGSVNTSTSGFNYLVRSPVDGIPAYDSTDEIPGMAICEMVRRFSNHTDEDKRLADISTKQKVFNLGPFIPEGKIVICNRDCFGDLFIVPSGSAVIRFRLREELQLCGAAAACILDDGCEDDVEADEITIVDNLAIANITVNSFDEWIAPEGAIGFARPIVTQDPLDPNFQYELIYIDFGCCIETECLQIPRMHFAKIPEGVPAWALGYDENGCLIKFPVDVCVPCEPIPADPPP